jgi:hypothetical protein
LLDFFGKKFDNNRHVIIDKGKLIPKRKAFDGKYLVDE